MEGSCGGFRIVAVLLAAFTAGCFGDGTPHLIKEGKGSAGSGLEFHGGHSSKPVPEQLLKPMDAGDVLTCAGTQVQALIGEWAFAGEWSCPYTRLFDVEYSTMQGNGAGGDDCDWTQYFEVLWSWCMADESNGVFGAHAEWSSGTNFCNYWAVATETSMVSIWYSGSHSCPMSLGEAAALEWEGYNGFQYQVDCINGDCGPHECKCTQGASSTTTTTTTSTAIPGTCVPPVLPNADNSACVGIFPPNVCSVPCLPGMVGDPVVYTCLDAMNGFEGEGPECLETTTTTATHTITTTQTYEWLCETSPGCEGGACQVISASCAVRTWLISRGRAGYEDYETAIWYFRGPGRLEFQFMGTEEGYDWITIYGPEGEFYASGSTLPEPVDVAAGSHVTIYWMSDSTEPNLGWEFSFEELAYPSDMCAPPMRDSDAPYVDCVGHTDTPATCSLPCPGGFLGEPATYQCSSPSEGFVGTAPTCEMDTNAYECQDIHPQAHVGEWEIFYSFPCIFAWTVTSTEAKWTWVGEGDECGPEFTYTFEYSSCQADEYGGLGGSVHYGAAAGYVGQSGGEGDLKLCIYWWRRSDIAPMHVYWLEGAPGQDCPETIQEAAELEWGLFLGWPLRCKPGTECPQFSCSCYQLPETSTTTTMTTTPPPGSCARPQESVSDNSDCAGKFPPSNCTVACSPHWLQQTAVYECFDAEEGFIQTSMSGMSCPGLTADMCQRGGHEPSCTGNGIATEAGGSGLTCAAIGMECASRTWRISRGMDGYEPNEAATIVLNGPGELSLNYLIIEEGYEWLHVVGPDDMNNSLTGQLGAGAMPPVSINSTSQLRLEWNSDGDVAWWGWEFMWKEPEPLMMSLNLHGLDYAILNSTDGGALMQDLETTIIDGVSTLLKIQAQSVQVVLSAGSVVATIHAHPENMTGGPDLMASMQAAEQTMENDVATLVRNVPGIEAAATGEITVAMVAAGMSADFQTPMPTPAPTPVPTPAPPPAPPSEEMMMGTKDHGGAESGGGAMIGIVVGLVVVGAVGCGALVLKMKKKGGAKGTPTYLGDDEESAN